MEIIVNIGGPNFVERKDGEQLTIYSNSILKALMTDSVNRTMSMEFSVENQQRIAEEIGYRRALLEFSSYFGSQENS